MPSHGWRTRLAATLAGVLLLAACGGEGDPDPAAAEGSDEPGASASAGGKRQGSGARPTKPAQARAGGELGRSAAAAPSPAGDQAALEELAAAAQEAAKQERRLPRGPALGADISWPQCPRGMGIPEKRTLGMPMPLPEAKYVVVGLTNGPGFTPNPCLAEQVDWVRSRGLLLSAYAVSSYPSSEQLARHGGRGPYDGDTERGALRNAGVAQARYTIDLMREVGMDVPAVWVDVEPVPDFEWSSDPGDNAAVVEGVVRAYADAGYLVGVYSTPALWSGVVGDLALGLPEWRAAGQTSRAEAVSRCGADWVIQGGPAVMGQWVEASRDQNVTCPGAARDLSRFFSR